MGHARDEWATVAGQAAGKLEAKTLADVLDGEDEYDWLIPNLLERQDRLVLTGGEGAGKSTFVRQIAICAAAGVHPTTTRSVDPVRVLVIDAENSEKQWRRASRTIVTQARHLGQTDPATSLRLACVPRLDVTNERDLGAVHRLVDEHEPDLLVIGPLYRLIPRAITNDDDAAPLLTALDGLRARGLALVMEAHAGHASGMNGQRDLRPRGSAALMGWPEFGLGHRPRRAGPVAR
jgi:replicative DNA helicase